MLAEALQDTTGPLVGNSGSKRKLPDRFATTIMLQRTTVAVVVACLIGALALLLGPSLFGSSNSNKPMTWHQADEVEVAQADSEVDPATGQDVNERASLPVNAAGNSIDERTAIVLRGRIVDRRSAPVRDAKVWLDFARGGRGGPSRRVPEPVQTDADGRFAFAGQTFRDLRISLLVSPKLHAPKSFERNIGEVKAENDLGDLIVDDGGELFGRVTDLDGNGIATAEVRLQPDNNNPMRMQRDRELLLPARSVDNSGFYRFEHVPASQWRVAASAPRHLNGESEVIAAEEITRVDVADIHLGPGYELSGIVSDIGGLPVADADVAVQSRRDAQNGGNNQGGGRGQGGQGRGQGGQGGQGGPFGQGGNNGNDRSTKTDKAGRFALDHLPGTPLELTVSKVGFLRYQQNDIDAKLGSQLFITLQDGLKINGIASDAKTSIPVSRFYVHSTRIRALPLPGEPSLNMGDLVERLRAGTLDEAAMQSARSQMGSMRTQFAAMRGNTGGGLWRGTDATGSNQNNTANNQKPTPHPDGRFVESGLEEGVYLVMIESPDHARFSSEEVQVRSGALAPELTVLLQSGVKVSGVITKQDGSAIAEARVELRVAEDNTRQSADASANGRGGRGGGSYFIQQMIGMFTGSTIEATTDARGRFEFAHTLQGRYRVTASKEGFEDARTEPFALTADLDSVRLALGSLAQIVGKIRGATPAQLAEARVMAMPVNNGGQGGPGGPGGQGGQGGRGRGGPGGGNPFGTVKPDGTYQIIDLQPGGYTVRAFVGSGMRSMWQQFSGNGNGNGNGNGTVADVTVRASETATLDIDLTIPEVGTVRGSVTHNGIPAAGFQVTLRRQDNGDPAAQANGRGGRGGRGGGGGGGGGNDFTAAVSSSSHFTITEIPAGNYLLTISSGRRAGVLHNEAVVVITGTTSDVTVSLMTCSLEGTVTVDDGSKVEALQGGMMLLPGLTEVPENINQLARDGTSFNARVAVGKFAIDMLPPGNYLAVLRLAGRETTSAQTFAAIGQKITLTMPAGKTSPPGDVTNQGGGARGAGGGRGGRGANGAASNPNGATAPAAGPRGAGGGARGAGGAGGAGAGGGARGAGGAGGGATGNTGGGN